MCLPYSDVTSSAVIGVFPSTDVTYSAIIGVFPFTDVTYSAVISVFPYNFVALAFNTGTNYKIREPKDLALQ